MVPRQCEVCQDRLYKYKCPSCLMPYCSLECFKRHKENCCSMSSSPQEETISLMLPNRSFVVDETSWILGSEQLKCIAESISIQDALKDKELQKLIQKIDSSSEPEEELDKAKERDGFSSLQRRFYQLLVQKSKAFEFMIY
ncbi:hypothetical protein HPP92_013633 [Vanilla planifolia]|uniref:HIT-type domain-containing protein n=1 Tax=Vanilla planifolia TaxID=51239 RepID=A0A835UWX0_VANPL|nr:hypothetical protein HPP92_013633 [Vanilla planifolia]